MRKRRKSFTRKADAKRIYDDIVARFPQGAFATEARTKTGEIAAAR